MNEEYDLDHAYQLDGPEDAKRLYAKWADTYDDSFGSAWGYVAPRKIAELFLAEQGSDEPILDIGAGTGLIAEHLNDAIVDAFDITPEMLEIARPKRVYRNLIVGDLTKSLELIDDSYGGVISCGTFTHGHVGPECLPELLRVTRPGALFCCGTIPGALDGLGFGSALAKLVAAGRIEPVRFSEITIYDKSDHSHADDRGLVIIFRTK